MRYILAYSANLPTGLQDAPIKNNLFDKIIISVIITVFVTKFTVFTEKDSGRICTIYYYNSSVCLKIKSI